MNIRSVSHSITPIKSITGLDLRRRIFKYIPNFTVNCEDFINKTGTLIGRPDVNRAIMGLTAIATQPFIDYYNPKVDKDTATVSTCRTAGKIIAGTLVGCGVRSIAYYGVQALTNIEPTAKAWQKSLLPIQSVVDFFTKQEPEKWIKNYRSALATIIGLLAMTFFTNIFLDVPLTNKITKKLLSLFKKNKPDDNDKHESVIPNTFPSIKQEDIKTDSKKTNYVSNQPNPMKNKFRDAMNNTASNKGGTQT